jgi:hypothetical protein
MFPACLNFWTGHDTRLRLNPPFREPLHDERMNLDELIEQLPAQAASLERTLLDPRMPRGGTPALSLSVDKDWRGYLDGREWRFRAGVAGAATISVFAAPADEDPDHVVGASGRKAGARAALPPAGDGRAWLKLKAAGEARGNLARNTAPVRLQFSGRGEIEVGSYLRVDPQQTLRAALDSRRGDAAFALDAAQVRALGLADACYLELGGKLSARVEVDWADALSVPIEGLRELAPTVGPLALLVDAKASVAVDLELSDSFRLVFTGRDEDRIGASLQRSASEAFGLEANARVVARLANPDIARDLLAGIAAQLFGVSTGQIERARADLAQLLAIADDGTGLMRIALARAGARLDEAIDEAGLPLARRRLAQLRALAALASIADPASRAAELGVPLAHLSDLGARLDRLAADLAERIGSRLDALLASLQLPSLLKQPLVALRGLLERLDRLESVLSDAASRRVQAGFEFEYRRVAQDEIFFSAVLGRAHPDFERLHGQLLALDVAAVLEATRHPGSGIALESFLHQKTVKRSVSLGLDLGGFYSDRDSSTREWSEALRILPDAGAPGGQRRERHVALKGNRTRVETAFGSRSLWRGDFAADFASGDPGGNNGRWRFSLALGFRSATPSASAAWLNGAADYAAIFGVVPEPEVEALAARLRASGAQNRLASVELSFVLRPGAFEHEGFVAAFADVDEARMRAALSAALQRIEGFADRCDIARRRTTYLHSVEVLLGTTNVDLRDADEVAAFVAREMATVDAELRSFEAQRDPPSPGSVADISRRTGSLLGLFREFREASALARFCKAASPGGGADRKSIEKSLAGWDLAWRDRYPLRWQALLLRELARGADVPATAVESRLKLVIEGKTALLVS